MSEGVLAGTEDELSDRLRAVSELGAALRELNEMAVSSEVDTDILRLAAQKARELVPGLRARRRSREELPSVDDGTRRRMYNPVSGPGSPLAPPMVVEIVDGLAVGTCTLGLIYEGPPGYVHGGISALLIDQILGHANAAHGMPGMTVDLSTRYRRPVPLQTPLRITGTVVTAEGRSKTVSRAAIATADAPETVLVEGEGTFIALRPDQVRRLFGSIWAEADDSRG